MIARSPKTGVTTAQGGPGNDAITPALRNGWRNSGVRYCINLAHKKIREDLGNAWYQFCMGMFRPLVHAQRHPALKLPLFRPLTTPTGIPLGDSVDNWPTSPYDPDHGDARAAKRSTLTQRIIHVYPQTRSQ
jgi:hypothetical protein